jgi:DNA-binding IclR family transcriptional regulator
VKLSSRSAYAIAVAVTDQSYRLHVMPGSEMPLHAAASSRILLAYQDDAARRRYLSAPLEKITPLTKTELTDVLATVSVARRCGYATCLGEVDPSTMAYAVPVFSPGGVVYSVGVTGPQFRINKWSQEELLQRLRGAADKLRRMLEMAQH